MASRSDYFSQPGPGSRSGGDNPFLNRERQHAPAPAGNNRFGRNGSSPSPAYMAAHSPATASEKFGTPYGSSSSLPKPPLYAQSNNKRGLYIDVSGTGGSGGHGGNSKAMSPGEKTMNKYGGAWASPGRGPLLSPGSPDDMHFIGRPLPRKGASRYIVEDTAFGGSGFRFWSARGWLNIGSLVLIVMSLVGLFAAWPVASYFAKGGTLSALFSGGADKSSGGVLITNGSIPTARTGLIDSDTPTSAYSRTGYDGEEYELVFSDEFNVEGRSFWKGDDPFWEAVDLHYWPTGNLEWYDPDAVVTKSGALVITISEMDKSINHNLSYRSAMLQSWNQMCFTGGYIEASVMLPGGTGVGGFWPAVWTMGNLGRAGYGASTHGTWPYSYNSCDPGAMPNQTDPKTGAPGNKVTQTGNGDYNNDLSWLPGQRLSRCTCKGEAHPGPQNADGSYVGRASPEIDVLEAFAWSATKTGFVSQTLQTAPFDPSYTWDHADANYKFHESGFRTQLNSFRGGAYQESVSAVSTVPSTAFQLENGAKFTNFGFEYWPTKSDDSNKDAFVTWTMDDKPTWTVNQSALDIDTTAQIARRPISFEPMYMIFNLGMSDSFVKVETDALGLPAEMKIDYIRVYQRKGHTNVGCDPRDMPTMDYIANHAEAYQNMNLTVWEHTNFTWPKDSMQDSCSQPTR